MFNPPKHFVFRFGETLSKAFESWWKKHNMEDFVESITRPAGSSTAGNPAPTTAVSNEIDGKDRGEGGQKGVLGSEEAEVNEEEEGEDGVAEEEDEEEEEVDDGEANNENDDGTDGNKNKGASEGGGATDSFVPMFDESTKSSADD
mmetsp:Transcript_22806/g.36616  ORF Transcript_22806/g.36616 Transcript_22806/m.36616 type:complete len:146 (+) Transcript_22806:144-581(+)